MFCFNLSVALVAILSSPVFARDLPPSFKKCKRYETLNSTCLVDAANLARDRVSAGIRELGIPPIDPLVIPSLYFEQGTSGLNYKITIRNATIHGLDKYSYTDFRYDPETLTWTNRCKLGAITLVGECDFDGKILVIPLRGSGLFTLNIEPTETTAVVNGKLVKKDGVEYYKVVDVKVNMPLVDGVGRFDNFVGASQEIVNAINRVLKENSKELIQEIAAPIQKVTLDINRVVFEGITNRIPYNKLLPIS